MEIPTADRLGARCLEGRAEADVVRLAPRAMPWV
jgi:hypothetical protein